MPTCASESASGCRRPLTPDHHKLTCTPAQSRGSGRGARKAAPSPRFGCARNVASAVSDQDLVLEAQAWRHRATALLDASGLTRILGDHGRLVLSGAYAYDTMMSPDIDLHLIPDVFSRYTTVEILNVLIDQDWWNTLTFGDWVQDRFRAAAEGGVTRGYLLQLAGFFEGRRWKVDAWLLDPAKYPGDLWATRMAGMTAEQRLAVLRIKAARARGALRATGVAIYTAVLEHQIATPEAFVDWQRRASATP